MAIISGCFNLQRGPQMLVRNDVENPNIPEEANEESSDCLVFILFRAKKNPLAKGIRRFADLPKFEHWALGFQFTPGKLILVEMSNQNMKVIPRYVPETSKSYLECQFDYVNWQQFKKNETLSLSLLNHVALPLSFRLRSGYL